MASRNVYYYTPPRIGSPHSASVNFEDIPINSVCVAYAHTHPNSNFFSSSDTDYANNYRINGYVVGPNCIVQRYNYVSNTVVNVASIQLVPLSTTEKNQLLDYRYIWDSHFQHGICPNGFGCENMTWPNG